MTEVHPGCSRPSQGLRVAALSPPICRPSRRDRVRTRLAFPARRGQELVRAVPSGEAAGLAREGRSACALGAPFLCPERAARPRQRGPPGAGSREDRRGVTVSPVSPCSRSPAALTPGHCSSHG